MQSVNGIQEASVGIIGPDVQVPADMVSHPIVATVSPISPSHVQPVLLPTPHVPVHTSGAFQPIATSPRSSGTHSHKHDLVYSRMVENLETSLMPVFGEDLKAIPGWNGRVGEPNDFDGSKYYVDMMTRQLGFTTIKKCKPENNKLILLCERYGESHSRRVVGENDPRPRKTKKCGCDWTITLGNFCQEIGLANGTKLPSGVYIISYSNSPHNHELISSIKMNSSSMMPPLSAAAPDDWMTGAYVDENGGVLAGLNSSGGGGGSSSGSAGVGVGMMMGGGGGGERTLAIGGDPSMMMQQDTNEVVEISRSQTLHLRHQLNELASLLCAEGSGIHYSNLLYLLRHIQETKGATLSALRQTIEGFNSKKKRVTKKRKESDMEGTEVVNGNV